MGVRSAKTGALMGIITSIPVHTRVYDKTLPMAEINFLCVHKKLRYVIHNCISLSSGAFAYVCISRCVYCCQLDAVYCCRQCE